jgi:hypothetical protein
MCVFTYFKAVLMASDNILGLIAGQGRLPFLVADGAKRAGLKVVCVGLSDNADPGLAKYVDVFFSGVITRPGRWMRRLRKYGASRTVMVGRVAKSRMYTPWRIVRYLPDWRALRIWYWRLRGKDKRNETVLCAIADELASGQIYLENSTMYCKEHLADEGVMTKCRPSASVQGDIEFGWPILQKLAQLDIGQAIAVKEKEIIAVEAIEGTAEMIERAGELCKKGGWTLIKGAKANKDMRFDVPCVGPDTIESLAKNGARCLVVQKEKTIIIDKPETIALADKAGVAIVGY